MGRGSALGRSGPFTLLLGIAVSITLPGCTPGARDGTAPPGAEPSDAAAPGTQQQIVVRNGTLIDGTGTEPLAKAVVVIADGRILEVGAEADVAIPPDATIVDAQGGAILPGLVDTHTHLLNGLLSSSGDVDRAAVELYLETPLHAGLTTFRDAGSRFGLTEDLPDLREALAALGIPLPTIVSTGPVIAAEGNLSLTNFAVNTLGVADVPEAVAAVNDVLDRGADQIKIMVDEWETTGNPTPSLTADQIAAITEAAHQRGAWVLAHVADIEDARMAIEGGADELTHWPGRAELPGELISAIVSAGIPVGTTYGIRSNVPFAGDVRRLLDAGGTIVISTDAPGVMAANRTWQEMDRMVLAGMTPMEAIIASTRDAARALGLTDVGTIEAGMVADLLIVSGNPLDGLSALDDLTVVIKNGVVVVAD